MIPKIEAQKKITTLWFTVVGLIFIFLLSKSIIDHAMDVVLYWGWFFPLTLPIISLISSVLVLQANAVPSLTGNVSTFVYRLTLFTSFFYLLIVSLTLIASFFVSGFPDELLSKSGLWLGPIQGIAGAFIGIFFFKEER